MKTIAREVKDLGWLVWGSFKEVLAKKTIQMAAMGWLAGIVCSQYGCDKAQLAAWGLTGMAMLQQALKDLGSTAKK